jgi:uncharacterized protein
MTSGPARTALNDVAHLGAATRAALLLVAMTAATGHAAEVALYRTTVPLKSATEADRNAAFGEALRAVVVRASGRRDAASNPQVSAAAGRANRLVQQYSATADGALRVGFDAATIDELLGKAGLPAWPSERPATLVVMPAPGAAAAEGLALRAGDASPERAQLELAAQARGVPLVWPLAQVSVETIRARLGDAGVEGAVRAAGTQADAVLIAADSGGQPEWMVAHLGQVARRRGSAVDGVNLTADTYADIYAPPSTRSLSTASVRIDGIESLQSYAGLLQELESLSIVRGIAVTEVNRSVVRVDLTLRGDLELLRRVALLTPTLRPASSADAAAPQFVYLP